jgi:hypothetical protein
VLGGAISGSSSSPGIFLSSLGARVIGRDHFTPQGWGWVWIAAFVDCSEGAGWEDVEKWVEIWEIWACPAGPCGERWIGEAWGRRGLWLEDFRACWIDSSRSRNSGMGTDVN